MTQVFISYSRKDKGQAQRLTDALTQSELDTWIDWEDIPPTADWMEQIHKGIEAADAFLFLLSPDSVMSEVCGKEVEHAVLNGKRLIPLVGRDVNPKDVHPALAKVNWIYCREQDDFSCAIEKLLSAIRTDLAWVESHKRLQVRALEWEKRQENSLLLRGKDLREAEETLASVGQKDPQPTDLQRRYLLASRRSESRSRNFLMGIGVVVMAALALLSVFAIGQRNVAKDNAATAVSNQNIAQTAQANAEAAQKQALNEANIRATAQANAETQARVARGGELAAQAISQRDSNFDLSLLLSIEAFSIADTYRTKNVLLDSLQANPPLMRYLQQHTAPVRDVVFSPDGKRFASMDDIGVVIIWDAGTYQPVGQFASAMKGSRSQLAISMDSTTLATVEPESQSIMFWDIVSRQPIGPTLTGISLAFSPDGKLFATGNEDGTISLWDALTRQPMGDSMQGEPGKAKKLAFSPDGKVLASFGAADGRINLWSVETRKAMKPIDIDGRYSTAHAAFSPNFLPDSYILASGGGDGVVVLAYTGTLKIVPLFNSPKEGYTITALAYNSDGNVFYGDMDGSIVLRSPGNSGQIMQTFTGHQGIITALALSPDENTLVSASSDQKLIVWDLNERYQPLMRSLKPQTSVQIDEAAFNPSDGGKSIIASGCVQVNAQDPCEQNQIFLLDGESGKISGQWAAGQAAPYREPVFSPNGKFVIFGDGALWDMEKRQPLGQPLPGSKPVFSPDGKTLAFIDAEDETTIILWDLVTLQPAGPALIGQAPVTALAFSPDGKMLVSGDRDETLTFWDVATHQPIGQPVTDYAYSDFNLTFHPDGKVIAFAGSNYSIVLLDVTKHQVIGKLLSETIGSLDRLAFSPDGQILATGEGVTLWDVSTRQIMGQPLTGFGRWVTQPFSPDGTAMLSLSDGIITLLDLRPQTWMEKVCERAGRNFTRAEWKQYGFTEDYRATCSQWPLEPELTATPTP